MINLKKIIYKREVKSILDQLTYSINSQCCIQQLDGKVLMGSRPKNNQESDRCPIKLGEEVIGWVSGEYNAALIASIISYAVKQEFEKKSLAQELLEKYQEIDLFQDISNPRVCLQFLYIFCLNQIFYEAF